METLVLFGQLAWTFFVIGAFTIGGGYAMLSLIQNQVVVEHPWISESTFTDIVAVSQMTPGPIGINSATYVGYDVLLNATGSWAFAARLPPPFLSCCRRSSSSFSSCAFTNVSAPRGCTRAPWTGSNRAWRA